MWIINYFTDWLKGSNDYFWTATSDVMAKSTDKKKKIFPPRRAGYVRRFTLKVGKMQSHVSTTSPTLHSLKYWTLLRENLSVNKLHNVERQEDCER